MSLPLLGRLCFVLCAALAPFRTSKVPVFFVYAYIKTLNSQKKLSAAKIRLSYTFPLIAYSIE